jgi:hypothetical protein
VLKIANPSSDPACALGLGDTAFAVTLGNGIRIFRSDDVGKTWEEPVIIGGTFDREYIAIDRTQSRYRGRVYVSAMAPQIDTSGKSHGNHIVLLYSANGGHSFSEKVGVPLAAETKFTGIFPGPPEILADGTVLIPYRERTPGKLVQVTTSIDGGEHLTPPTTLSEGVPCSLQSIGQNPQVAVDDSSGVFRGRVYVVWLDKSSGRCETMLAYSSDQGKSWSKPIIVDDNPPWANAVDDKANSFLPAVAVNKKGVVGVSWYAFGSRYQDGFDLRFAASTDGGDSFQESI